MSYSVTNQLALADPSLKPGQFLLVVAEFTSLAVGIMESAPIDWTWMDLD